MKRFLLPIAALALCSAVNARAEMPVHEDSLRMYNLQEIEVTATRATGNTPVAYTNLSQEQITRNSYGLDIPSVLALTPSMVATNETGIGIGGTAMRLRGTDATRLNVTINGVSMNNPDSHSMYWYDTPDLISSVNSMQVQRGAGISTNGTGAFGGAINMATASLSTQFEGEASLSYGSYNTNKQAVRISSGLMGGHWAVDARLTHIGSDGYIDRGATDLKSYMFQAGYYSGNTMVKFLSFGGKAKTYLTYNGATKEEMEHNGRRYNSSGMYQTSDSYSQRIYNSEDGEWQQVNYYDDQTDNYLQINNQLLVSHRFNDHWAMNATAFYTYGYGYYKQYKDNAKLFEYLFPDKEAYQTDDKGDFVLDEYGSKIKIRRDLIREKIMRNHLGGANFSALYTSNRLEMAFGGSWSYYACPHWGELDWMQDKAPASFTPGMRWYDNDVNKQDANIFARANWNVAKGLNLFADMQYRYVHYKAWGVNDNYDKKSSGMQPIDVDEQYHFFNPRAGISYTLAQRHNFYASFAIAQKEPTRSDFTDRYLFSNVAESPSSEKLYDYELGYSYSSPKFNAGVNLYYMKYTDQLVQTGIVNDSSDGLNINVPDSYRRGIELSAQWRVANWFTLGANGTFSQNKIKDYVDQLADSPTFGQNQGDRTISYSPNVIAGAIFDFHYKGFEAVFHTQYVGQQYFTNNEIDALSLDSYCVTNLNLSYTLRTRAAKSVRFGLAVYNLFDATYSSNGYGYSYVYDGKRTDMSYYFPQAPLNVLANVTVRF
ncbi:MAG: TonB-dependent receptor [Alistipes sp.]